MPNYMIDVIDRHILEILQQNSQLSNQELADRVALSPSPCSRRVKQLEQSGFIKKYVALLSPEKMALNLSIMVFVGLDTHAPNKMQNFELAIKNMPEVTQCYLIAGHSADYLLKVHTTNLDQFQKFLMEKLTRIDGVSNVQSNFVLKSIIDNTALPLDHLS